MKTYTRNVFHLLPRVQNIFRRAEFSSSCVVETRQPIDRDNICHFIRLMYVSDLTLESILHVLYSLACLLVIRRVMKKNCFKKEDFLQNFGRFQK